MKTKLLFILCCLCSIGAWAQIGASTVTEVKNGGKYTMESYKKSFYKFVAEETGTLVLTFPASFTSTHMYWMPTVEEAGTEWAPAEKLTDSSIYIQAVEKGKTYTFGSDFPMGTYEFTVTFSTGTLVTPIKLVTVDPEKGSTYVLSLSESVGFIFNKAVNVKEAKLIAGTKEKVLDLSVTNGNTNWAVYPNTDIKAMMANQTLKEGDTFSIKLTGVTDAKDEKTLYNEDGIISVDYKLGKTPVTLVSASKANGSTVKPFYDSNNKDGDIVLTFSDELLEKTDNPIQAIMSYGDVEGDNYGQKEIPFTLNGTTVTLHLQNIQMNAANLKGNKQFSLKVSGLFDKEGNPIQSNIIGGTASITLHYTVEEKSIIVSHEFTPDEGESLDNVTEIECWVSSTITFDGAQYAFKRNGKESLFNLTNNKIKVKADPDYAGAQLISIPFGNFSHDKGDVTLTINDAKDENGSPVALSATFKSNGKTISSDLSLTSATPANKSTLPFMSKITFTLSREVGHIDTAILKSSDENDKTNGLSAQAQVSADDAKTYTLDFNGEHRMLKGNTYTLVLDTYSSEEACQYQTEEPASVILTYSGSSDPEKFSDIVVESIEPDPKQEGKISSEKNTFTVTFTRPVVIEDSKVNYGFGMSNEMAYKIDGKKVTFTIAKEDFDNAGSYINCAFQALEELADGSKISLDPSLYDESIKDHYFNLTFAIDKKIVRNTTFIPESVEPANKSTVENLEVITLTFPSLASPNSNLKATVYDANDKEITTGTYSYDFDNDKLGIITLKTPITAGGTYKVVIPEESFATEYWDFNTPEQNTENDVCSPELTYTYTILGLSCTKMSPVDGCTLAELPADGFFYGFDGGLIKSVSDVSLTIDDKEPTYLSAANYQIVRGVAVGIKVPEDFSIEGAKTLTVQLTVADAEKHETSVKATYFIGTEYLAPTTFIPTSVTPEDNSEVEKIESVILTFPKFTGSDYVGKATFTNDETNEVIKGEFSDGPAAESNVYNQVKITPSTPITEAGTYTLKIAKGSIFDEDYDSVIPEEGGTTNPDLEYHFTIGQAGLSCISINPEDGSTLSELPEPGFIFTFDGVVASVSNAFIMGGKTQMINLKEENYQILGAKVLITTPADFTLENIPFVSIHFDVTDAAGHITNAEATYEISSTGEVPATFVPTTVVPADGSEVTVIESVVLTFPKNVNIEFTGKATFINDATEVVTEGEFKERKNWNEVEITLAAPITAAGTYTLKIAKGSIFDEDYDTMNPTAGGTTNPDLEYHFTVVPTGIQHVLQDVTGVVSVYTPQGILVRRADVSVVLEGLERGIYIVNGKKIAVE